MKYRLTATGMAIILMTSCAMLTDLAMDAISPDKGGINTELVLGDKNQTLGTNQEVKAEQIGTVVGQNDNHTDIKSADDVTITNQNFPAWFVAGITLIGLIGWMAPTPTNMFKYFRKSK